MNKEITYSNDILFLPSSRVKLIDESREEYKMGPVDMEREEVTLRVEGGERTARMVEQSMIQKGVVKWDRREWYALTKRVVYPETGENYCHIELRYEGPI